MGILESRDEDKYTPGMSDEMRLSPSTFSADRSASVGKQLSALRYLFYGRKPVKPHLDSIHIGPINSADEVLSIAVDWYALQVDEDGNRKMRLLQPDDYNTAENPVPRFTVQVGRQPKISYPLRVEPSFPVKRVDEINCIFVTANGLEARELGTLWDSISLTDLEKEVLTSLRIIAPGVEGFSFVGDSTSTRERIPILKIADIDEPLPLRSLGDGMQRVFGLALALVGARDGILLIDEIENSMHYSVQPELWQLIFRLAYRLNIQVFATTHNWDCIEAFQVAAQEDKQEEGLLVRLSRKKGEIAVTLFDEEELEIVTRERIEVR